MLNKTTQTTVTNRKIHDAEAMPVPKYIRISAAYIGCREYRYTPLPAGSSIGVAAKLIVAIVAMTRPTRKLARPIGNHAVPSLSGMKIEYAVDKSHKGVDRRLTFFCA
jgi:hypothetical protein